MEKLTPKYASVLQPSAALLLAAVLWSSPSTDAATVATWTGATGNWSTSGNWSSSPTIPGSAGDVVNITSNITANATVTIDTTSRTLGVLNIGDTNASNTFTLAASGGATLTLDNSGAGAQINQISTSKGDTISGPLVLNDALTIANAATNTLTISNLITSSGARGITLAANSTGGITLSGTVNNSGAITNSGTGTGTVTISGMVGANVTSITQNGASALVLSGANSSFAGGVVLSSGTLSVGSAAALGTGTLTINGGTIASTGSVTLSTNNAIKLNNDFSVGGSTVLNLGTGGVVLGKTITITQNNTATNAFTIGGNISDGTNSYGLVKDGAGVLNLSGSNSFKGGVTLKNGSLTLRNAYALGSGTLTINGGTLIISNTVTINNNAQVWAGDFSIGTFSGSQNIGTGTVTLTGNRAMTVAASQTFIVGGVISDGGSGYSLALNGPGSLALTGSNTFSGGFVLNTGAIKIGSNSALGVGMLTINGGSIITSGATLATSSTASNIQVWAGDFSVIGGSGYQSTTGNVTLSNGTRTVNVNGGQYFYVGGNIADAGNGYGLVVTSSNGSSNGVLALGGASTYGGSTTVNAGILRIVSGNNRLPVGTQLIVTASGTSAGTFDLAGNSQTVAGVKLTGGAITSSTVGGVLTSTSNYDVQSGAISAKLAGSGIGMDKTTSGTVTLSGSNTFDGVTTVSAGEMDLNTTGANALSGSLTVNGGSVKLLQGNQIASNQGVTVSSGTLDIQANNQTVANLQLTGGLIAGSSGTLTSTNDYNFQAGTVSSKLGGTVGLNKTTSGVVILSGSNTFTGITSVSGGTLQVDGSVASETVSVGSGATLSGSGTASGLVNVNGGTINGNGLNLGATTFSGTNNTLAGVSSASSIVLAASGDLSVTGTTTGNLTVNSGATLHGSGKVNGAVGATSATINGSGLNLGSTTLYGTSAISGTTTASSIAVATGTTTFSNSITSNSTLSVAVGATLNNTGTTSATTITVNNGATLNNNGALVGAVSISGILNGTGVVNGSLTIESTGELAPGNSPGVTTVTGALTVKNGAKVSMQLDGLNAGSEYDQIVVGSTGSVNLQTGSVLDLSFKNGLTLALNDQFVIIDNQSAAAISGTFGSVLISGSLVTLDQNNIFSYNGQKFELNYAGIADTDSQANDLVLTVVPEPSTWAMLLGGVGMLALTQRVRNRRSHL